MQPRISLPVVVPDREPLTELEAIRIGDSVYRLRKLRRMLKAERLAVTGWERHGPNAASAVSHPLTQLEAQGVLALLIEREELFLASFNVAIEGRTI